jgi:hypothetical protein
MVKTWAIGSLALGAALFGTALYVQTRPLAFTQTETVAGEPAHPLRMEKAFDAGIVEPETTASPVTADSTAAVELAPLVVEGQRPARAAAPKATRAVERAVAPLEPCTTWRDLGPSHVVDGVALDARRVRELC